MGFFDRLQAERPTLAVAVSELDQEIAQLSRRRLRSMLDVTDETSRSLLGVGVVYEATELVPTVFLADATVTEISTRLTPQGRFVTTAPPPEEQLGPGTALECWRVAGRCAVVVSTMPDASPAILSAGHSAYPVGSEVESEGQRIGEVVHSDRLADHAQGELVADVSVVRLDAGVATNGDIVINRLGEAREHDVVVAYGQRGARVGPVLGAAQRYGLRPGMGSWANVLLVDPAISEGGDSGAPVLLDDQTGTIIGLVVGGHIPAYTVVQEIDYLLAASNCEVLS